MPPCPSCQHSCRCPPLLFHAGNDFPILHVMTVAESLPIASEKHCTGLQMLLPSVALKTLVVPVALRGHCKWLQLMLWDWCCFSWEKWSPNIRLPFQPCLSTGNPSRELMWVTCDLLIINFISLRHMEELSQLSVTRKTSQLSFKLKAYHSHVKSKGFPISFSLFPNHFKMTLLQPEEAADRWSSLLLEKASSIRPTCWDNNERLGKKESLGSGGLLPLNIIIMNLERVCYLPVSFEKR